MTGHLATLLQRLPEAERRAALADLSAPDIEALASHWPLFARPDQLLPGTPGAISNRIDWRTWLLCAGRGAGKTRSSAEAVRSWVENGEHRSIVFIGPTAETLRRDQVSVLINCSPVGPDAPQYEPSQRRVTWPNGAVAYCCSSEEPDRLRGLNVSAAWIDELCALSNQSDVYNMLQMALRIPGPNGRHPQVIISTTPKRQPLLKQIMADPSTVVTRARTSDNAGNLAASTLEYLNRTYGGTSLGRQELDGLLLDDVDGAGWNRALLDKHRVTAAPTTQTRVVVAVDPSGGARDAVGITVGCTAPGADGRVHGYLLADLTLNASPAAWARTAIDAYHSFRADRVVCESNFGGQLVESTLNTIDPSVPVKMVFASRGKAVRSSPIISMSEQGLLHLVGVFPELEDELCGWVPDSGMPSPNRLDAFVWLFSELLAGKQHKPAHRADISFMYR